MKGNWKRVNKRFKRFLKYEPDWSEEGDLPVSREAAKVTQQIIDGDVSIFLNRDGGVELRLQDDVCLIVDPNGRCHLITGY